MEQNTAAHEPLAPVDISADGKVAHVRFNRPEKRNAINDMVVDALEGFFEAIPEEVRCVILSGEGGNFSAGLDLSEHVQRQGEAVLHHSRNWHRVMELIQFSGVPVVALLTGAVMGGGLEIASACHVRIAEGECQFRLPEGQRGIFVGGGATARLSRIIGPDRLTEMMLTGRTYDTAQALQFGLAHYRAQLGEGLDLARDLAGRISANSRLVNYLVVQGVSRIADMPQTSGLFAESLAAALSTTSADATEGLEAFLEKRTPKFI
jgi:enoyl-CoA hydratase/carnithine racemase